MIDENPFAPPQASVESVVTARKRPIVAIVPATLCFLAGSIGTVTGIWAVLNDLEALQVVSPQGRPVAGLTRQYLEIMVLANCMATIGSIVLLFAARAWLLCKWKIALFMTIAGPLFYRLYFYVNI